MATEARAIIDYEQPYNVGTERRTFDRNQWKSYLPSVLCKMLDKHRSLAVIVAGISKPNVQVSWCSEGFGILRPTYVAPGDELSSYKELSNRIPVRPGRLRGSRRAACGRECEST